MVDLPALFRRSLEGAGILSPVTAGSPYDEGVAPVLNELVSRDPDQILGLAGPYMKGIVVNDDSILQQEGSQDLRLFNRLLDDDVAMSCLQQRRLAITSRDWEVTPGDDDDPRSVKASEDFRDMLSEVGFDRVSGLLHYAVWFGYGIAEALWTTRVKDGRTVYWLDDLIIPDRRWFGFDFEGRLRFIGNAGLLDSAEVPPNKFVTIRTGGTHDFSFYGLGLAHWVYWPIWFKKTSLRHWAMFLQKMSSPTAVGEFEETDGPIERNKLIRALINLGKDSAVTFPKGTLANVKFMEATRNGGNVGGYREFVTEHNEAIMRVILGQPGTSKATAGGIGSTQADVHADVKAEIVKADADLICESLNNTIARWVTLWNHGPDVAPPKVYRVLDDVEDVNKIAERDSKLHAIGWTRTEDSVGDVYGDGYERKEVPAALAPSLDGRPPVPGQVPANDDEAIEQKRKRAEFDATDPRPLYVERRLQNVAEFKAWATAQGFTDVDSDLHVTVLYSKTAVNWFAMGQDYRDKVTIEPGGPRVVDRIGDDGAIALHFASSDLTWRHDEMIRSGATHDFPDYRPHVTITYSAPADFDVSKVEPYVGKLEFGPELFREIEGDPSPLSMFSAAEDDEIDRLTAALLDEANPILSEFAAGIRSSLADAREAGGGRLSVEGARVALLQAFEQFEPAKLAKATGLAFVAERAAAEAGVEDDLIG